MEIVSTYTRSFSLLNQFDSNALSSEPSDKPLTHAIVYEEALKAIEQLKQKLIVLGEASELVGR
jgi:hypothetical protein